MIQTIHDLLILYKEYGDPIGKINREIKKNNLFSVLKGIYETNINTPGHYLTAYIYGPSYLSFEFALSFHGLIPEKVVTYTSATFNKLKSKVYQNVFGMFTYRDVPNQAYPHGVKVYIEDHYSYFIATKEKALCDQLYKMPPQKSMKSFKTLLFEDLRIDEDEFRELNFKEVIKLSKLYKSTNIKLLKKTIEKEYLNYDNY